MFIFVRYGPTTRGTEVNEEIIKCTGRAGLFMFLSRFTPSYLEIYNETVKDLLGGPVAKPNMRVREHTTTGPYVEGASLSSSPFRLSFPILVIKLYPGPSHHGTNTPLTRQDSLFMLWTITGILSP